MADVPAVLDVWVLLQPTDPRSRVARLPEVFDVWA